ncbi:hypothetical protein [Actinoallomurus acaciae]|uniref:SMI1/KNR4 family protein n=1 Tax=Actinoallomurus acaciae TaxID=502577 RepID=A0ABV5YJU3_9ACTN
MAVLADLEVIVGPPAAVPPPVDWPTLERISGLVFPQDYKELAARYGMLEVDAFLAVNHLGMPAEVSAMLRQCQETLEGLRILVEDLGFIYVEDDFGREVEAEPYPFYPDPGGLFPWGATQNGDTLLWLTDLDPNRWTIVVTDGGTWWHFDGGIVDFLVGILSGTLQCPVLPAFSPSELRVFQYASLDQLPHE